MIRSFALLCLLASPALAQGTLTRLAGPYGPGYSTEFIQTSGDGRVALVYSFVQGEEYLLMRDGTTSLLSAPDGYNVVNLAGLSLSGNGRVVCGGVYTGMGGKPLVWVDGGPATELALPSVIDFAYATAINNDGSVIGGVSFSGSAGGAMRWINGVPSMLTMPNYGDSFSIEAISADGWTMVGAGSVSSVSGPARWTEAGGLELLDAPGDASYGRATSLSADGRWIVGGISGPGVLYSAALWDEDGQYQSLHLPSWTESEALAIDAAGSRVFLSARTSFGDQPFLYDIATGIYTDLAVALGAVGGPDTFSHHLRRPRAMSADGNTFFGDELGVPLQFSYYGWSVGLNEFGRKVCGSAAQNSTGATASLLGAGSLSVSDGAARLTATLLPPGSFGMLLTSRTAATTQLPGSTGTLCLGGDIGRFNGPGQVQAAGTDGTLAVDIQLSALPTPSGAIAALPGETWFFQTWFRDSGNQSTKLTDALQVVLTQ